MKRIAKSFISLLCAAMLAVPVICTACNSLGNEDPNNSLGDGSGETGTHVDYVGQLHLDLTSNTKKQEVTVRNFIDGDTTHFDPVTNSALTSYNAADFKDTQGYIKARYLAINTPESTGQIEEWGKKASKFTRSKLEPKGTSIIVESDVDYWDIDSTGERYLLWVWYKPQGETEYRNLNVEILQEGLAFASRTSQGIYGETAQKALDQARAEKLYLYSGEKDPDFYYGPIKYVSIKELRCFADEYQGVKVSVEGTIVAQFNNSVYIEAYDGDTELYFGIQVFYGYNPGTLLQVLKLGNRVEVVGTFEYSEIVDAYQISGLSPYDPFNPSSATNCKVLEEGVTPAFTAMTDPAKLVSKETIEVVTDREDEDGELITVEMVYGEAVMSTSVTVENLYVDHAYVTNNGGDSDGAMTLYCKVGGVTIQVRTEVLKDEAGNLIKPDQFVGKTITVKGIIEKYNGTYQIKVYRADFITIVG